MRDELDNIAREAGIQRPPSFVVDKKALTASAATYGRPRNYTIQLNLGLLKLDSEGERTRRKVVLHELAHIKNGDVNLAYATTALWRTFAVLVLLPFIGVALKEIVQQVFSAENFTTVMIDYGLPVRVRSLLISLLLFVLILLSRADILKIREHFADLTAIDLGADPGAWSESHLRRRKPWNAMAESFRSHPSDERRKLAILDSTILLPTASFSMFLTGIACALTIDGLSVAPGGLMLTNWWSIVPVVVGSTFITAVVAYSIRRASWHEDYRSGPYGARVGIFWGLGLALGSIVQPEAPNLQDWLPANAVVLVFGAVLIGLLVMSWAAAVVTLLRSAQYSLPGKIPGAIYLIGFFGVIAYALKLWIYGRGVLREENTQSFDTMFNDLLLHGNPSPGTEWIRPLVPIMASYAQLGNWGPALLWIVPAAILAFSPGSAMSAPGAMVSPTRALVVGVLGGVLALGPVIGAMMLASEWPKPVDDIFFLRYTALLSIAASIGLVIAVLVACIRLRPHRALGSILASAAATFTCLFLTFILSSLNGCIDATNVGHFHSCGWRPIAGVSVVSLMLPAIMSAGVVVTVGSGLVLAFLLDLRKRDVAGGSA